MNLERGLFNIFEPVFNSIHTHLVKPDPNVFDYVLSEIKTNPDETVFIDDAKENVEEAIKAGIVGIQFIGFDQLKADLRSLNVNVD
jgi:HAD superfamily hydrolase (TIGR01509 family)